jgi:Tfp pilus assembly protein PilN
MINILPPAEKNILYAEEKKKISLILEILGLVFFVCLILILASMQIYISGKAEAAKIILEQEKDEFEFSEIKNFSEKIRSANEVFTNLDHFYQNQVKLTEVLEEVSRVLPEGIQLSNFSYRKSDSQVSVFGFSQDRETLLKFREKLEQEEKFEEVYFPSSCWIKPTEITFNSSFKFRK